MKTTLQVILLLVSLTAAQAVPVLVSNAHSTMYFEVYDLFTSNLAYVVPAMTESVVVDLPQFVNVRVIDSTGALVGSYTAIETSVTNSIYLTALPEMRFEVFEPGYYPPILEEQAEIFSYGFFGGVLYESTLLMFYVFKRGAEQSLS